MCWSINIPFPIITDLGPDTTLCDGNTITLNADVDLGTFNWQDGSNDNTILVENSGTYWLEANNQGCISSDSIQVAVTTVPMPNLGADQTLCEGTPFTLDANFTADTYQWQDGSDLNTLSATAPGLYWVELTLGQCQARDSVLVDYIPFPIITDLGADTTLCDGDALTLTGRGRFGHLQLARWQQ